METVDTAPQAAQRVKIDLTRSTATALLQHLSQMAGALDDWNEEYRNVAIVARDIAKQVYGKRDGEYVHAVYHVFCWTQNEERENTLAEFLRLAKSKTINFRFNPCYYFAWISQEFLRKKEYENAKNFIERALDGFAHINDKEGKEYLHTYIDAVVALEDESEIEVWMQWEDSDDELGFLKAWKRYRKSGELMRPD